MTDRFNYHTPDPKFDSEKVAKKIVEALTRKEAERLKPMNIAQLNEWLETMDLEDEISEYDDRTNKISTCIYQPKSGEDKFYRLDYMNDHICERQGDKGIIRDEYLPVEVKRHVEMVEEVTWRPTT
jgi:hypothetical protein